MLKFSKSQPMHEQPSPPHQFSDLLEEISSCHNLKFQIKKWRRALEYKKELDLKERLDRKQYLKVKHDLHAHHHYHIPRLYYVSGSSSTSPVGSAESFRSLDALPERESFNCIDDSKDQHDELEDEKLNSKRKFPYHGKFSGLKRSRLPDCL